MTVVHAPRLATIGLALCLVALLLTPATPASAQTDFFTFESGPVRPVALSPDGSRLFVANIPDAHVEVFDLTLEPNPEPLASIPVGLEPVALLALSNDEVWVVNHLSDSVSIVSVSAGRVTRTLLVGDEPRDIVVADPPGPTGPRVFVSTAHRGQHRTHASIAAVPGAGDPQFTTAGVGRADVWVFDPNTIGATVGGTPIEILSFFADTPRALAVSPDQSHVYLAAFHSGNQTTAISEGIVCDGFASAAACAGDGITSPGGIPGGDLPGGNPGPGDDHDSVRAPEVGLIVKWDPVDSRFEDEDGSNWSNGVRFTLPDEDVFAIEADTLTEAAAHSGVGTILLNMVANPVSGKLYVSNTDANNLTRFEGSGIYGGSTVQGHIAESRITVVATPDGASTVTPRHLNTHIPYGTLPAPAGIKDDSLATPTDMVVSPDGSTLYVAAFGSSKVGVFDTAELEGGTFTPDAADHIGVSGGGPGGLALSADGSTLYVLTRFDNGLSVIDTATRSETFHWALPNPEPPEVVTGRPMLYDAFATSSNGEASCSSCHIFGDMDDLAWDLGDPDGSPGTNPLDINFGPLIPFIEAALGVVVDLNGDYDNSEFHPMKGPMTTQTLRGMVNSGAMHWRGDRADGFFGSDPTDADLSFRNFIVAFPGLLGMDGMPAEQDMQDFANFALRITLPPNPVRALDNALTSEEQNGADFFDGPRRSDGLAADVAGLETGFTCEGCHGLDSSLGQFGTDTNGSFENESQLFKVPHLRNMYQKVGMFGMPHTPGELAGDNGFKGDQIRGFGFLHDGSIDTLFRFFRGVVFAGQTDPATGFQLDSERRDMEAFMLAFDTDLAPIVGQQITRTAGNGAATDPRIDLLVQRADASFTSEILGGTVSECDLIAKAVLAGSPMGWVYTGGGVGSGSFDGSDGGTITDAELRALTASTDVTFSCVPPGSGVRMGINRDRDVLLDGADNCPGVPNDGQENADGDAFGDACDPTPLPEPGQLLMLACGLLCLRGAARRRGLC